MRHETESRASAASFVIPVDRTSGGYSVTNRSFLLCSAAVPLVLGLGVIAPAQASDYDWSGFYAGFAVGTVQTHDGGTLSWDDPDNEIGTNAWIGGNLGVSSHDETIFEGNQLDDFTSRLTGTSIEFVTGYDEVVDQFLYGVELSISSGGLEEEETYSQTLTALVSPTDDAEYYVPFTEDVRGRAKIDWLSQIQTRAGIAIDRTLLVASAGVAVGHVTQDTSADLNYSDLQVFTPSWRGEQSQLLVGYVVGLGVDQALDDHWIVGASAEYFNLGEASYDVVSDDGLETVGHQSQAFDGFKVNVGVRYKF